MIKLAAFPGKMKLKRSAPLRVLIDNSVLRHGLTHTNTWISTGTKYWGGTIPIETGYTARVPRDYKADQANIYEDEIPFFASLGHLAKSGHIHLFTSKQLSQERWRQPNFDRFRFGLNIWSKVDIECLPDIPGTTYSESIVTSDWWSATSQTDRLLRGADPEFLLLCQYVSSKNLLDLYHLWTAKKNNCSIFLTTDGKLPRIFTNLPLNAKTKLEPVRVLRPSELGKELGLHPVSHRYLTPMDCDWFYEAR